MVKKKRINQIIPTPQMLTSASFCVRKTKQILLMSTLSKDAR